MIGILRSPTFRSVAITVVVILVLRTIFELTGFGDWVDGTPAAIIAIRIFAVLILGGLGLIVLLGARHDPELKRLSYRLSAFVVLLVAAGNAALLVGGENLISNLVSE